MYNLKEERVRIKLLIDLKELQIKHNITIYEMEYTMDELEVTDYLDRRDFI